jgi:hypothetical protein
MNIKEITIFVIIFCISVSKAEAQHRRPNQENTRYIYLNIHKKKKKRIPKKIKDLEINKDELQHIQFDTSPEAILKPVKTSKTDVDETLPFNNKRRIKLTLMPYNANTPYNWDPVYHCRIVQRNNKWVPKIDNRDGYAGIDSSAIDSMYSIVVRERLMKDWQVHQMPKGGGAMVNGVIRGVDLMKVFEKSFWQFRLNKTRERTLEVLKEYANAPDHSPAPPHHKKGK